MCGWYHRQAVDFRKTYYILPNLFTLSSVLCGFASLALSASGRSGEDLYLAAYGRMPNLNERKIAATSISEAKDKQKSAEDLLWAMMNSKEFVFNH